MTDVLALGELLIDFTQEQTDTDGYPVLHAHPGGAPANFLATLQNFGLKTALIGKVGTDAFGELLIGTLNGLGMDTSGVKKDPDAFTTLAFVTLNRDGERCFSFSRKPGADTGLRKDELDFRMIDETALFHFGTLSMTDEPAKSATVAAVEYAERKGKRISFDPNYRAPLWKNAEDAKRAMCYGLEHADIVKISDEEVGFLFSMTPEEGADYIFRQYEKPKLVLVSCGKDGCQFRNRNGSGSVPAMRVSAVDSTGAGDIFFGSFLFRLQKSGKQPEELNGEELSEMLSFACRAAGLSVQRPGGIPSIPELSEVERTF